MDDQATEQRVIITTDVPGVVVYGTLAYEDNRWVVLRDARHVFRWEPQTMGLFQLAHSGPHKDSKISPPVDELRLPIARVVLRLTVREDAAKNFDQVPSW